MAISMYNWVEVIGPSIGGTHTTWVGADYAEIVKCACSDVETHNGD